MTLPPGAAPPARDADRPADERRRANRRRTDRRLLDRRGSPPPSTNFDSWLSGWGDAPRGYVTGDAWAADRAGDADPDSVSDSGYVAREMLRQGYSSGTTLPRILRTYVAARAVLGLALVLLPWVAVLLVGGRLPLPMLLVSLAYAGQAVSLWLLQDTAAPGRPASRILPSQWLSTIGVDLLAFAMLRLLDSSPQLNFAALLVLPVLMGGMLTSRLSALATAAAVTLVLLAGVWIGALAEADFLLQLSQAGLAGAGTFLIALLASELSLRLAGEERSARDSLELARQQTQLNRVVIEEMTEGVLVVDRNGRLRAINPAGRQLLGEGGEQLALPCAMTDVPALAGLQQALQDAYVHGRWPEAAREQLLAPAEGEARAVQVRARFTRRRDIGADGTPPEDICVLFLEDLRVVRARQRQDKLAAMGRVSAGIAHEIRNPLAAIAQANALLQEDGLSEPQARLARIVADNTARLKRIVDDVMAVAPGTADQRIVVDAVAEAAQVCSDWRLTATPAANDIERLALQLPTEPTPVLFDPEHLRRVLVNLLDNAARHASVTAGAVQVSLARVPAMPLVRLSVASDGEPVAPEVERHLFEPFFSTRSRGSGLGLYICRELCERHGASIEFRRGPASMRHRNVFSVVMRAAPD
jgi:two-component system, NtrC family, sensor histidine kinase PilS